MKIRLSLLLSFLLAFTVVSGQGISRFLFHDKTTTPSVSLSRITTNHVYSGTDRMLVYVPPGYDNNSDDYPVVMFYHGDGTRGVCLDATKAAGTGNGVTTSFPGSFSNTQKIVHTSVVVKDAGVTVATGRNGIISGSGVAGTYDYNDGSSAAYTLTFTTAPITAHAITINYTQSNMLSEGPFAWLNLGDQPGLSSILDRCIVAAPQISRGSGDFANTEWDNALNYLTANFRVDEDRIYGTGLSLGSDMMEWLFNNQTPGTNYTWAAYVGVSPGSDIGTPAGGAAVYTNATNKGKLYVRGSTDPNGPGKAVSMMSNCNASDREFPVQAYQYWNIGHSSSLWDDKVYKRKYRTDVAGTADFDYIIWLLRFSNDLPEQATLMTRYAEATQESEDYRIAKRQVDNLSSGATKTALLADLATLKTSIGNSVRIDYGTPFYATTGNYNNVTASAAGTTVSNLIDDTGANTGIQVVTTTATASSPAMLDNLSSNRTKGRQFGFELNTNQDGMLVGTTGAGVITFNNLNNAKTYTIKVYAGTGGVVYTNRPELETTVGGSTQYLYCEDNTFRYVKFTGRAPSSGSIAVNIAQRLTASTEKDFYLQALELIEE